MARSKKRYEGDGEALSSNPFAALLGDGEVEASPEPQSPSPEPAETSASPLEVRRLVVRKEKKGRGGKTATIIEGFVVSGDALDELATTLKKSLGCSGRAVGSTIELGGARQEQVAAWLRDAGVKKVVVGN